MSSAQSSMRQRIIGTRTASVPSTPAIAAGNFYQFIPTVGNYVDNYPPGYMVDNSLELSGLLAAYYPAATWPQVLRDMGKTIKAVIGANATTVPTDLSTGAGFFREYQVLVPGFPGLNGVAGSSSGVIGGPGANTGGLVVPYYYTVYVPIVLNGNVAAQGAGSVAPIFNAIKLTIDGQL